MKHRWSFSVPISDNRIHDAPTLSGIDGEENATVTWQLLDQHSRPVGDANETTMPETRFAETVGIDGNLEYVAVNDPVSIDIPDGSLAASVRVSVGGKASIVDLHRWMEVEDSDASPIETGFLGAPESRHPDVIVVSDGFERRSDFIAKVESWYAHCLSRRPFSHETLRNSFTIKWLFRSSADGGTAFAVTQSNSIHRVFSGKANLVRKILAASDLGYDPHMHVMVLCNLLVDETDNYGGAGGSATGISSTWRPAWTLTRNTHWLQIATHELGHAFGLVDEYDFPDCGGKAYEKIQYPRQLRNVSATDKSSNLPIPWREMLSVNAPNNFPTLFDYAEEVAIFEGAKYCEEGWFRPSRDCLMRSVDHQMQFCPVCTEVIAAKLQPRD